MTCLVTARLERPGVWTYAYPKGGDVARPLRAAVGWQSITTGAVLFIAVPALFFHMLFAARLWVLGLLPMLGLLSLRLVAARVLGVVPATTACAFPRNDAHHSQRSNISVVLTVSVVWIMAIAGGLACITTQHYALGDQWTPFARTLAFMRGGPFGAYGMVDAAFLASGFLALTGNVWWPTHVFLERSEVRRRRVVSGSRRHA